MSGFPLDGVETEIVKQGLSFLFSQGGEILKRRRAAKDKAAEESRPSTDPVEIDLPPLAPPEGVFVPDSVAARVRTNLSDSASQELALARTDVETLLSDEAGFGLRTRSDVEAVVRLRDVLSNVYGAPLQFNGEPHVSSTTINVTDRRNYGVHVEGGKIKARNVIGTKGQVKD